MKRSGPRVLLTSNFPRPGNEAVAALVRSESVGTGFDWLSPRSGVNRFDEAALEFASHGLHDLAIANPSARRSGATHRHLVLSGGEPIGFREEAMRPRTQQWLLQRVAASKLVVAASGGAMLLTPNVSIFRLLDTDVPSVVEKRGRYAALGCVPFEVLPHGDRQAPTLIEAVERYAALAGVEVWCLPDGAAVCWDTDSGAMPLGAAYRVGRGANR